MELRDHLAGLPSEQEAEHITAKLFDLACLGLQVALVKGDAGFYRLPRPGGRGGQPVGSHGGDSRGEEQLVLIQEVQTEAFWKDITLPMIENVRRRLRGLVKFIERRAVGPIYTVLTDEIGESSEIQLNDFSTGIHLARGTSARSKAYIRANEDHRARHRQALRHNKPLTPTDLQELGRFVYESDAVGKSPAFRKQCYGSEVSLPIFVARSGVWIAMRPRKPSGAFLDANR